MYILKGSRIQAVSNSVKSYQTKGCGTHGEKQETNRHLLKTNATAAWVANIVPENLGRRYANHFRLTGLSYLYKKKKKRVRSHISTHPLIQICMEVSCYTINVQPLWQITHTFSCLFSESLVPQTDCILAYNCQLSPVLSQRRRHREKWTASSPDTGFGWSGPPA